MWIFYIIMMAICIAGAVIGGAAECPSNVAAAIWPITALFWVARYWRLERKLDR